METVTLLRYRHSYQAAVTFLRHILPRLNLVYLSSDDRARALDWFRKLSNFSKSPIA